MSLYFVENAYVCTYNYTFSFIFIFIFIYIYIDNILHTNNGTYKHT